MNTARIISGTFSEYEEKLFREELQAVERGSYVKEYYEPDRCPICGEEWGWCYCDLR